MHWAVYCRVIDNYGDIGFAWRLAVDLAERGQTVGLVADDASALAWLAPQGHAGVRVTRWDAPALGPGAEAPDVAVETFGCGLPATAIEAWRSQRRPPLRIDVEHLSAESFVERSHGLASLPPLGPGLGPTWYFYPGFTAGTGGLLGPAAAQPTPGDIGQPRRVSVFCYESCAYASFMQSLTAVPTTVTCAPGAAIRQAMAWRAAHPDAANLSVVAAPFVAQAEFDQRLRSSHLNVVRGEDSLVRAIWARRPFIWQLYPQDDGAHATKLEAFLDLFLGHAGAALAAPLRAIFRAWNGPVGSLPALPALPQLPAWQAHCERFAAALAPLPGLSSQLIEFALARR